MLVTRGIWKAYSGSGEQRVGLYGLRRANGHRGSAAQPLPPFGSVRLLPLTHLEVKDWIHWAIGLTHRLIVASFHSPVGGWPRKPDGAMSGEVEIMLGVVRIRVAASGPKLDRTEAPPTTMAVWMLLAAAILSLAVLIGSVTGSAVRMAHEATVFPAPAPADTPTGTRQRAASAYGKLPLLFTRSGDGSYAAQGAGVSFAFSEHKATLAFQKGNRRQVLGMRFLGASSSATIAPGRAAHTRVNYLTGSDRSQWRRNMRTYEQLTYQNLWPGIDMVFSGRAGRLKYEFRLAPGADPSRIRLAYEGATGFSISGAGALLVRTPQGTLPDSKPRTYELSGGRHRAVPSRFQLHGGNSYGFVVGNHDVGRPLVIDPGLTYSTYLGGTGNDVGYGIAVDSNGNAYVVGYTIGQNGATNDFPVTSGSSQTNYGGLFDGFVSKLNSAGTALVYSTYLGGTESDLAYSVAVDASGSPYVTGYTQSSSSFPTTPGALKVKCTNGCPSQEDAFVTKLSPAGSSLSYSTLLGGPTDDYGYGLAVDPAGQAYVSGITEGDFPTSSGAFDTSFNGGGRDAFVSKLSADGSALVYSTYLGGSGDEPFAYHGLALDGNGSAYVTGATRSADFPTTSGVKQPLLNNVAHNDDGAPSDAYVTKLSPTGNGLIYSTYLGGSGGDNGEDIAVDSSGNAYVVGETGSFNFPTHGAFQSTFQGGFGSPSGCFNLICDAFVTKLNATGTDYVYSTFLGGNGADTAFGVDVDAAGDAYVVGETSSTNFPTTGDAVQPQLKPTTGSNTFDAFVAELNVAGSNVAYGSYLGGDNGEYAYDVDVDDQGAIYLASEFTTTGLVPTPGAIQPTFGGGGADAAVTKIELSIPRWATGLPAGCPGAFDSAVSTQGQSFFLSNSDRNYSGSPLSYKADTTLGGASAYGQFDKRLDPPGPLCEFNNESGRAPLAVREGDDIWYSGAFVFPTNGFWNNLGAGGQGAANVTIMRLEGGASGWAAGLLVNKDGVVRLNTSNGSTTTSLFSTTIPKDDCWHFFEINQKLSSDSSIGKTRLWIDGHDYSTVTAANFPAGSSAGYNKLKAGIVLRFNSSNVFLYADMVGFGYSGPLSYIGCHGAGEQ